MTRSTKSINKHSKHKKVLKIAKGAYGRSKNCYKIAKRSVEHRLANKFISRKQNKRNFRTKFIRIINAHCIKNNIKYSQFIHKLNNSEYKNNIDRKTIALLIQHESEKFNRIFESIIQ